ncbi:hypothetical protein HYPGJ_30217 [Hyphomicrobium sp. GJ21]|nr:hypothetical protein HYPGJ_30217 [Hyphomicrobium sp. GJ21]
MRSRTLDKSTITRSQSNAKRADHWIGSQLLFTRFSALSLGSSDWDWWRFRPYRCYFRLQNYRMDLARYLEPAALSEHRASDCSERLLGRYSAQSRRRRSPTCRFACRD